MKPRFLGSRNRIGIKVGDIMTRSFVDVKPDTSLINCARDMAKKHVGSLVVKDEQNLKGIITEKDIIWALTKRQDLSKIKVRDIMTRRVVTIKPSADIYDALMRMHRMKLRLLPVIVKGKVIGLLTMKDIIRIEPSLFDIAKETFQIREKSEKIRRKEAALRGEDAWIKEGECSECGTYGLLYDVDNSFLCESCKDTVT